MNFRTLATFAAVFLFAAMNISCTKELEETKVTEQDGNKYVSVSLSLDLSEAVLGTPDTPSSPLELETKSIDDPTPAQSTAIHNLLILQYGGTDDSSKLVTRPIYLRDDVPPTSEDYLNLNDIRLVASEGEVHTLIILANTYTVISEETLGKMLYGWTPITRQADIFGHEGQAEDFPGGATPEYFQRMNAIAVTTVSGDTKIRAHLRRSYARINIQINNTGLDGLQLQTLRFCNVPKKFYYISDYHYIDASGVEQEFRTPAFHDTYDAADPQRMNYPDETLTTGSGAQNLSFTYYMPCNMRGEIVNNLPSEKNRMVPSNGATYIELLGGYGDEHDQPIVYTFYLGADLKQDFNINPNSIYNYTFTFNGKGNTKTDSRITDYGGIDFTVDANCYMMHPSPAGTVTYSFNVVHRPNIFWGERYDLNQDPRYVNNFIATNEVWKARIIWSDFEMTQEEAQNFLFKRSGNGGGSYMSDSQRVKIKIPANHPGGSALIGVYTDDPDNILWSWHIWITDYNPDVEGISKAPGTYVYKVPGGEIHRYAETYVDANGVTKTTMWANGGRYENAFIMDRNLGALDDKYHDKANIKSKYYQFGRKDPFNSDIYCWTYDPNTFLPSQTADGAIVKTSRDILDDVMGIYKTEGKNMPFSVGHPDNFITSDGAWTLGDVFNPNPYNANIIWQDPYSDIKIENEELFGDFCKSFFDPCPPGWTIPRNEAFLPGFIGDGSGSATGNFRVNCQWGVEEDENGKHRGMGRTYFPKGYLIEKSNSNPQTAFFPVPGYRSSGTAKAEFNNVGYYYRLETRNINLTAIPVVFNSSAVGNIYPESWFKRANGYVIRCIKEE